MKYGVKMRSARFVITLIFIIVMVVSVGVSYILISFITGGSLGGHISKLIYDRD